MCPNPIHAPGPSWPDLPDYAKFSAEDHAAHTTPKGLMTTEQLLGVSGKKQAKDLFKFSKAGKNKPAKNSKPNKPNHAKPRRKKRND